MSFNTVPTVANGDSWSAAQHNTYLRDNFAAVWVGTTAGDVDYYVNATSKARVGIGTNGYIFQSNGSVPSWQPDYRVVNYLLNGNVALQLGDNAARWRVPVEYNGFRIASVGASRASGGTGTLTLQLRNAPASIDILSTKITIDSGETDSSTAAAAAVINTSNDDLATGNQIVVDVDDPGTNSLHVCVSIGILRL